MPINFVLFIPFFIHFLTSKYPVIQAVPTATILVSAIEEITGVSQMVMFPDGYSRGISMWTRDDDCVSQSFQDMATGFPRLEEFGTRGPSEVSR